jgi:hypothetical protein
MVYEAPGPDVPSETRLRVRRPLFGSVILVPKSELLPLEEAAAFFNELDPDLPDPQAAAA